jgi:cytochrome b subunit of formate dehydrogenase
MKSGEIISFVEGNKLVTTEKHLDNYWKKKIVKAEIEAERKKKWLSKN